MKKLLISVGIVLVLIFCVLVVLPFVIDINPIVAKQIPAIEKQLNRKIVIGDVKLTLLTGLGAEIKDVQISNNPDFTQQNFVSVDSLKATVQLLPLFKKEVLISSVSINMPSVLIERDAKGRLNFSDMISIKTQKKAPAPSLWEKAEEENPLAALEKISVSKISIKDGNFIFIDAYNVHTPREISFDKLNLMMKEVSLSKNISIDFETDVHASPKAGHISLSGDFGPIGKKLAPENIPVDMTLSVDDVNLTHLAQYIKGMNIKSGAIDVRMILKGRLQDSLKCRLDINWDKLDLTLEDNAKEEKPAPKISIDGSWQIEANASGTPKSHAASGKITLDKSAVRYGQLFDKPADTQLNMDFDLAVNDGCVDLKKIIARIDTLEASLAGHIDKGPVLGLNVKTNHFSANKLVSLSPTASSGLPKDLQLPDAIQLSASAAGLAEDLNFKADMDLTEGRAAFGNLFQKEAGIPLSLNVNGLLKKDALRLDNLKFILSKIVLTGSADISNFANPSINGTVKLAPTSLNALAPILPTLKAYKLEGNLAVSDVSFKGKIDKLKNLTGVRGSLSLKNGSAASAELGKKIENIQATVNVADNAVWIRNTSLRIGLSDLNLNATIRSPMKPDIIFNLASNYLDIDALMPASTKEKQKDEKKKSKPVESKTKAKTSEKQNAPDLKANGKVSIKKCKYNKLDFENILVEIQYEDAVATLKNLSFDTFDGNIKTSGRVYISDMQSPKWNMDLATRNINANKVLNQFTTIYDTVFGSFNSDLALQGKGSDWQIISKSLVGKGFAGISNGKLANINLLDSVSESLLKFKGLSLVAQAISPEKQKRLNETEFKDLTGKFSIEAGKIIVDAMKISAHDFTLSGKGAIGLDKSLDLDTAVLLTKSASERLQRDNTLKYLLNNDQQLEIPCAIKGDMMSPRISADGNSLNRLLENAATKAVKEQIQKKLDGKAGKELDNVLKNIFK